MRKESSFWGSLSPFFLSFLTKRGETLAKNVAFLQVVEPLRDIYIYSINTEKGIGEKRLREYLSLIVYSYYTHNELLAPYPQNQAGALSRL